MGRSFKLLQLIDMIETLNPRYTLTLSLDHGGHIPLPEFTRAMPLTLEWRVREYNQEAGAPTIFRAKLVSDLEENSRIHAVQITLMKIEKPQDEQEFQDALKVVMTRMEQMIDGLDCTEATKQRMRARHSILLHDVQQKVYLIPTIIEEGMLDHPDTYPDGPPCDVGDIEYQVADNVPGERGDYFNFYTLPEALEAYFRILKEGWGN